MIEQMEITFLHDSAVALQLCPYGSDNTVYAVRSAHPNARYRSHFTNTENVRRNGGSHDDFVDIIVEDNVDGDDGIDIKINPDNALSGIKRNKCGYLLNSANSRFVRRKRIND